LVNSGFYSSRLGFRGVEDLGGGLSAGFWLEAGVANDNGAGAPTNTNNQGSGGAISGIGGGQGLTFNRRSTISLASTTWGEIRAGRDFSPWFLSTVLYDPFAATGLGANQIITGQTAGGPWTANGGTGGPAVRTSNGITYFLPTMSSGVYGAVQHFLGENSSGTAIEKDGTGTGVRAGWASGPFDGSFAYGKTNYATGDITSRVIGVAYQLGIAKLTASVVRDSVSGALPGGKGWLLGANITVGAGQIVAAYSKYETTAATSVGADKLALGYIYNLSKRTALFTDIASLKNHGTSAQALNGATTAAGTMSTGLDIGIRHSF